MNAKMDLSIKLALWAIFTLVFVSLSHRLYIIHNPPKISPLSTRLLNAIEDCHKKGMLAAELHHGDGSVWGVFCYVGEKP